MPCHTAFVSGRRNDIRSGLEVHSAASAAGGVAGVVVVVGGVDGGAAALASSPAPVSVESLLLLFLLLLLLLLVVLGPDLSVPARALSTAFITPPHLVYTNIKCNIVTVCSVRGDMCT